MSKLQTAQRVSQQDLSDNFVFQRSLLAYRQAADIVGGNVLEIGTGSGYGASVIAPKVEHFTTIDKCVTGNHALTMLSNVNFIEMTVPPLKGIKSEQFDYVVIFQVIEHIKPDKELIGEIARVLKPSGRLILSTPNRHMSLTRNPWHVREYDTQELIGLLSESFEKIETLGVFGNKKVNDYYEQNRISVEKITKFDILRLQKWLPRILLRIPYDIANRLNRRKLLKENTSLTTSITLDDYHIATANDNCYDLFFIAQKR